MEEATAAAALLPLRRRCSSICEPLSTVSRVAHRHRSLAASGVVQRYYPSLSLSLSLHFLLFHGASIDSDLVGLVTDLHADRGSDDGEGRRRTWKQTAAAVVQGSTSAAASKVGSSRPTNAAGSSSSYVVANIKETSNLFPI